MEAEKSALGLRIGSGADGRRKGSRGGGGRGWRKEESTPKESKGRKAIRAGEWHCQKEKRGTPNKFKERVVPGVGNYLWMFRGLG